MAFHSDIPRLKLTLSPYQHYHKCAITESCANYHHTLASEMEVLRGVMIEQSFNLLIALATLQDKQVMTENHDLQTLIDIVSSQETPSKSHLFLLLEQLKSHPPLGDCTCLLTRLLHLISTNEHPLVFYALECIAILLEALGVQNIKLLETHRIRIMSSLSELLSRVDPRRWRYATAFVWLCAQTHLSGARLPSKFILEVTARFLCPNIPKETVAIAVWLDLLREWTTLKVSLSARKLKTSTNCCGASLNTTALFTFYCRKTIWFPG